MKRKKIKIVLFLSILLIITFGIIFFISNNNSNNLEKIGYSSLELKEINKLTQEEINIIEKYKYNKNLIYIIESDNYDSKKLELYIKYTLENSNIDYLKIFELINHENFIESNIDNYITLLKKFNNVNGIITYINNYNNKNINIDELTLNLICEKYFIIDNLDRYLNYYKNNSNLELEEIITRVNSKLDYIFYDDSISADISKGMYTLVNKYYYLDQNYVPDNLVTIDGIYARDSAKLVKVAYDNFIKMADSAKQNGLTIKVTTGYRSYNFQSTLYNNYVKMDGVKNADTYSARPGYSEHQLGYSADLTNKNNVSFDEFEYTDEYKWLQDNAHKFGFIMRYPKNKEYITGYIFESWHYRYVGVDIATYIYENNITYEEYYEYYLR